MNFSRKITSKVASLLTAAIFCTLSLTSAFAGGSKNNFEGKTYVMTGMFAGGMDITSLMGMAGVELKMEVTFVDSSTYKATVTSNGETEESTGEYTINAKEKTVTLLNKDSDNLDFTYSEDFSTLSISAPIEEGMTAELVLTEKSKAKDATGQAALQAQPEIDYGSVKTNIFKGKTYKLTKILLNGMDATSLIALSGQQFKGSLKFIDEKNVILDFLYGDQQEKDSGTYAIDYEKNTITFDGDTENSKAIFYNKGSVISFDFPMDGMTLNLIFEN